VVLFCITRLYTVCHVMSSAQTQKR